MKAIYLYPGDLKFTTEPALLNTMLGSCVGIALFDHRRKWGGLNHYLLPGEVKDQPTTGRYGLFAIQTLISQCLSAGSNRNDLVARVFGGASVIGNVSIGQKVGELNIALAFELLKQERISVIEQNVGGLRGRKISFNNQTGLVLHSFLGLEEKQGRKAG